jgi:hypothetical protein
MSLSLFQNLKNPIISLKKTAPGKPVALDPDSSPDSRFSVADSPIPEPECVRTYYMGPYGKTITFSASGSVGYRVEPTCNYYFIVS